MPARSGIAAKIAAIRGDRTLALKRLIQMAGVLACLCSFSAVQAQPPGKPWPPPGQGRPMPPSKQDERRYEHERQRGAQWERMSPEERRQLREDIGHHGREIYRGGEKGGRPGKGR
jgi:hypothetical protein